MGKESKRRRLRTAVCSSDEAPAAKPRRLFLPLIPRPPDPRPLGLPKPLRHLSPIDHVPPRRDVVRTAVLVFQVVGVLPHVEAKKHVAWAFALHEGIVLVGRAGDRELRAILQQP